MVDTGFILICCVAVIYILSITVDSVAVGIGASIDSDVCDPGVMGARVYLLSGGIVGIFLTTVITCTSVCILYIGESSLEFVNCMSGCIVGLYRLVWGIIGAVKFSQLSSDCKDDEETAYEFILAYTILLFIAFACNFANVCSSKK